MERVKAQDGWVAERILRHDRRHDERKKKLGKGKKITNGKKLGKEREMKRKGKEGKQVEIRDGRKKNRKVKKGRSIVRRNKTSTVESRSNGSAYYKNLTLTKYLCIPLECFSLFLYDTLVLFVS